MKNRRPIHGVGINDADYATQKVVNGKMVACPFYRTWRHMLERCYDHKYQSRRPTYTGCSVVDKWHSFMSFRSWMVLQDWEDKHMDKDAIKRGNKIYGPETCVFIDRPTNSLLVDKVKPSKTLPLGVSMMHGKYYVQCSLGGKPRYLGLFDDLDTARSTWVRAKAKSFAHAAMQQTDSRVMVALLIRASNLLYGD